jgi:hypothetical protein
MPTLPIPGKKGEYTTNAQHAGQHKLDRFSPGQMSINALRYFFYQSIFLIVIFKR